MFSFLALSSYHYGVSVLFCFILFGFRFLTPPPKLCIKMLLPGKGRGFFPPSFLWAPQLGVIELLGDGKRLRLCVLSFLASFKALYDVMNRCCWILLNPALILLFLFAQIFYENNWVRKKHFRQIQMWIPLDTSSKLFWIKRQLMLQMTHGSRNLQEGN